MIIKIADYSDKESILEFINDNWQENHIFFKWPELFDDYHRNGKKINYVIARDENDRKIYGICGFIYANHNVQPDVWLALWKVIPSGIPSLGLDIVNFLNKELKCRILACCGIKKEVKRLYEFLGYKTGTLKHYYRLNDLEKYKIACIRDKKIFEYDKKSVAELVLIDTEEEFLKNIDYDSEVFEEVVPYKDLNYLFHKYYHNIAYRYQVWGIKSEKATIEAVLFTKIVKNGEGKVLRIVDFVGNEEELAKCGYALNKLLINSECEYIDCYQYGLSESTFDRLGMTLLKENDDNIIPNYFEPFEQCNVDIHFFTSTMENFRMFKADGDQERPNLIEVTNE